VAIWKLISVLALEAVSFFIIPFGLEYFGYIQQLTAVAPWILGVTLAGMLIKALCGYISSDDIKWDRQGYEFCGLTFSASVTGLALQLLSDKDLFPGIPTTGLWEYLKAFGADIKPQRIAFLVLLLFVSLIMLLITAIISKEINKPNTHWKAGLSLINFGLGNFLFAFYIYLLIVKG